MPLASLPMDTPLGTLTLLAGDAGLAAVLWENDRPGRVRLGPVRACPDHAVLLDTRRQLREYFSGRRTRFDLPLDFSAAASTPFQRAVWRALLDIPYGQTRSYGEVAAALGRPKAVRAVGAANGRNPLSIVAPCHRVVGASGSLTGFAGGLAAKAWLLALEAGSGLPARPGPANAS